jgi:hypothetical protein
MSWSPWYRPERRALPAGILLLVVCAVQWFAATAAVATAPAVVAVVPGADRGHVSLVLDVGTDPTPVGWDSLDVEMDGRRQPATVVPVLSERTGIGLVIDASDAGAGALPGWLSGAARFVLEAPSGARMAAVTDTTPPTVVATVRQGPADVIGALSDVRPHGARDTADALSLATQQLQTDAGDARVVVLYTSASDAGGVSSADLTRRLTAATGGFLAPAGDSATVPAFDQVSTTLRARYLVSLPAPAHAPAPVTVRLNTGATQAVVPASVTGPAPSASTPAGRGYSVLWWVLDAVALAILAAAVAFAFVLRRRPWLVDDVRWYIARKTGRWRPPA